MIPFNIQLKPGISIYEQIIYAVKKAIVLGQLTAGDKFPSIRVLSQELHINPNTVQKAIRKLVDDKILEVRPGIGSMVAVAKKATQEQRKEILDVEVERLVVEIKRLRLSEKDVMRAIESHWKRLSKEDDT